MADASVPRLSHPPAAANTATEPRFDAERLDCYRVALEFQALAATLVPRRGHSALRDQLDRASISIALNIAEAVGRVSPAERAHFFGIARGSTTECAAVVDIVIARGLAGDAACRHARGLLFRLVQMLTRLAFRQAR
jgi:four helix bundle protein